MSLHLIHRVIAIGVILQQFQRILFHFCPASFAFIWARPRQQSAPARHRPGAHPQRFYYCLFVRHIHLRRSCSPSAEPQLLSDLLIPLTYDCAVIVLSVYLMLNKWRPRRYVSISAPMRTSFTVFVTVSISTTLAASCDFSPFTLR